MPAYPELSLLKRKPRRSVPVLLSLLVLSICLAITYVLWSNAEHSSRRALKFEFDSGVKEMVGDIQNHMNAYRQVLLGVKGFMHGSMEVSREHFQEYIEALRLPQNYPGIQGVALSEIVPKSQLSEHTASIRSQGFPRYEVYPPGDREIFTAITQILPFTAMNQRAFGYDMFSEKVRRAAMERARDTGAPALSGKVVLVQEGDAEGQPGFLMYLPVYRRGMPVDTVEQRRAQILGWVYAPFRINDFMADLDGDYLVGLAPTIYDGSSESPEACLFGCNRNETGQPVFRQVHQIEIAGRTWTVDVHSRPALEAQLDDTMPQFVALTGGGISVLLALLVWTLASGRNRALASALEMTRELRTSEFRWKFALEGAGEGVWDWDLQAGKVMYSKRWKAMLGYEESEIPDMVSAWEERIHPDDRGRVQAALAEYQNGESTIYLVEHRLRCKDGSWRWISTRGMAVARDEAGKPLRMIGTHQDVTEQKEAEQREKERQQALEETRAALQQSQRLEAVGKLTGGVAHDFNNVLQIISGNIQLLMHGAGSKEQQQQRLFSMLSAVERGAKLSSQLLAFARRQPLQPQVTNVGKLVRNMDGMIRGTIGESISVETIVGGGVWNAFVDPSQLENVILNLVINARDAMNGMGKLTLEVGNTTLDADYVRTEHDLPAGQYVVLAVSDTGTGISAEVMEHIFEPFFTTKPEGKGTGLGLSMAYGFMKQSGGHIRIYSEEGQGTTVKIYLPRSFEVTEEKPVQPEETIKGGNETVLVVEDDIGVQGAVVGMLQDLGYKVLKADDAEKALAIIRSGAKIDLLFTDVIMPGNLRSPDMARQAKEILPELAILFTSGYTQNAIVHGGRLDEGVHLLSKPYRQDQLARKVREVIDIGQE